MSSGESDSSTLNGDDLSEPKEKPKIVRVLTVVAYTLSVSMAAILLSVYYVFMWDGHPTLARKGAPVPSPMRVENYETSPINRSVPHGKNTRYFEGGFQEHEKEKMEYPYEPTAIPVMEAFTTQSPDTSTENPLVEDAGDEEYPEWSKAANITEKIVKMSKRSILFQRIINANLG